MSGRQFPGLRKGFVIGIFLTALGLTAGQEKAGGLPEAKGKATLEKVCVGCHELDVVTASRRTKMGWQQNVDDMVSRGAEGSDQEMAEVVEYLTKYYGKMNINTATAQQLQEFLELSEKEAQAIIAYRDHNGNIKDFEQLKTVPGLSAEKLQEKRSLIAFTL
jgi:competence protein ComEA